MRRLNWQAYKLQFTCVDLCLWVERQCQISYWYQPMLGYVNIGRKQGFPQSMPSELNSMLYELTNTTMEQKILS